MKQHIPQVRDVVMVGGGHTHALVLRKWGMRPVPGARLTLIHPGPTAAYSGMLPGHIAGHYTRAQLEIDVVRLARFAGARLIVGKASGVDTQAKTVHVPGHGDVSYDILALDVGVTSEMPQIPGFTDHVLPAKPLDVLADGWETFAQTATQGAKICVIGGGVAGAELALAAQHRLRHLSPEVTLIERGEALTALPDRIAGIMRTALTDAGATLIEGVGVTAVEAGSLLLEDGRALPFDCAIGAAGARPHDWVAEMGLKTENGYLVVDDTLRSVEDPTVYASGDCAHLGHAPRPKAGVFAVRAAPFLAHNLAADLTGSQRRRFNPQGDYLKLISLGGKVAFGEKLGVHMKGSWVWRWKDQIDQSFMKRLSDLPEMTRPRAPAHAATGVAQALKGPPPCGGCGAKLGAEVLGHGLSQLPKPQRADVALGAGDDAAVLTVGGAQQVISTDHLRAFTADPILHARVAALHAMGDIWAMGATPQAALSQITLPALSLDLQRRTLAEITAAAASVFQTAGADIVGGHTSQGTELQIGFTVTGLLDRAPLSAKGAKPGDALILSRPLGTGVILAAEMAAKAPGPVVIQAWHQMATPQGDAAQVLAPKAHAMTDVTGFGLAGHLWEMIQDAELRATVNLAAVPLLPGALELAESGVASSLLPENRADLEGILTLNTAHEALLCDPQTAGGFLAAVPSDAADALTQRLGAMGHRAAVIGHLEAGAPGITLA